MVDLLVRYKQLTFIKILQQTMVSIFPFALIGTYCWALVNSFLSTNSFFGRLTNIAKWFPAHNFAGAIVNDISLATTGVLALYAAFISAELTMRHYGKNSSIVGIASVASYILIFIHTIRNTQQYEMNYYNATWFIVGIVVGYFVGWIFAKLGHNIPEVKDRDLVKTIIINIKPLLIVLAGALIIHLGFATYRQYQMDRIIAQSVSTVANQHSSYGLSILISLITTFTMWLGYAGTLNFSSNIFGNESIANLSYALSHKTPWNIPYPYTLQALFNGFGGIGGVGATLALVIALILFSNKRQKREIAVTSAAPVFFNVNLAPVVGIPTILNPIYVIPFVLSPIVNMLLGSVAILLKMFPPLVYPVPDGIPGILGPLMETGGNIVALIYTIFILIVDVMIYIPFVKLDNKVAKKYEESLK
ncbi:PTS sugar transporter subunit IIC [Lactobacillus kitasatonis]|uniref:PTS sugar transporter subunit IIC n=2 Tax=Lactobacillus kitasatonis TaxID=237446 RepID=A0ABS1LWM7_9LACO|nr:PTS sugar transporter subunit IIC [Lactobacillus kitasatonis]